MVQFENTGVKIMAGFWMIISIDFLAPRLDNIINKAWKNNNSWKMCQIQTDFELFIT